MSSVIVKLYFGVQLAKIHKIRNASVYVRVILSVLVVIKGQDAHDYNLPAAASSTSPAA